MADETDYDQLRLDVSMDSDSLGDTEAAAIYTRAEARYTDAASVEAYTRVIALRQIRMDAAKLYTYKQNQSTENQSDIFKHIGEVLRDWQTELKSAEADAIEAAGPAFRSGRQTPKPTTVREYPTEF